ncbi:energy-coupling factor ABC transporter permease [Aestuariibacter halophilus]|uniref:Energy-coupling factor ABC transporter permease n=1 Tax=Fluctibacter halophilus TaxID=226011 RepID=A0ABS8G5K1_9ALTE|nr:energy-coupling factor ABC transporter permease [Aestuariibacter halophilus]MCC2615872.1 energy-coupling factor ABC transporter permease [Aestuariibacter halophilus]
MAHTETALSVIQILGWLGFGLMCITLWRHLPMARLREDKKVQHLVFGTAASVFVLWLFRAGIHPGLDVHFLWLTALTLILGLRFALLSALIALFGVTLIGKESWAMFGINSLLGVALPILCSYFVYSLSFHKLPRHLMVYVFVCAFLPGALMMALKMFALGGYYFVDGAYRWQVIVDNYLQLIPLMLFPEGMLNGMTMTLLIIYKPTWVYTFYDKYYLQDK